jgi:hypothetical protein
MRICAAVSHGAAAGRNSGPNVRRMVFSSKGDDLFQEFRREHYVTNLAIEYCPSQLAVLPDFYSLGDPCVAGGGFACCAYALTASQLLLSVWLRHNFSFQRASAHVRRRSLPNRSCLCAPPLHALPFVSLTWAQIFDYQLQFMADAARRSSPSFGYLSLLEFHENSFMR